MRTRNCSMKKNGGKVMATALILMLMIAIISIIAVLGGAIMKVFGFEYDSIWNIIVFFIIMAIISFPAGLVAEALPKVIYKEFNRLTKRQAMIMYLVLDTLVTAICMSVVDYFMESIAATDLAILIVSVLLAIPGMKDVVNIAEAGKEEKETF